MNRSYEVLNNIYKPYKITIKGKCQIFNTTSGDYVIKSKLNDLDKLYKYLDSRNFTNYAPLIECNRSGVNVFKYIDSVSMPIEQKALDLIKVVALLHNKTSYFKDVSSSTYDDIYSNIKNNIIYLEYYYNNLFDNFIIDDMLSPSKYYFVRNFYKIKACLNYCKNSLEDYKILTKNKTKQRVCLVHNNLILDHFIKNDNDYLISFDNYIIDSPILDIIKLYKSEYDKIEFSSVLDTYLDSFPLLEDESLLLFIMISIPNKVNITDNEFDNISLYYDLFNYISKTEELLKPYYSKEEKK